MAWARAAITFAPRLLPTPHAAAYLGVSPTKMAELPIRPKQLDGKVVYDRLDLEAYADTLVYQGEKPKGESRNSCDGAFGT